MKKLALGFLFIAVTLSFYACNRKKADIVYPEPTVEIPVKIPPEEILDDMVIVYETVEPFARIKDKRFEAFLIIAGIDKDNQINGKVAIEDVENVDTLRLSWNYLSTNYPKKYNEIIYKRYPDSDFSTTLIKPADNLGGIEYFRNLKYLDCTTYYMDSLDLSENTALTHLIFTKPSLKYLDISHCKNLKVLDMGPGANWMSFATPLRKIDISKNVLLEELRLSSYVNEIDLSKNINLKVVDVRFSYALKDLDLRHLTNLNSFLSTNCRQLFKICLSEQTMARIDTVSYENVEGWSRPFWQKDTWTVWSTCK